MPFVLQDVTLETTDGIQDTIERSFRLSSRRCHAANAVRGRAKRCESVGYLEVAKHCFGGEMERRESAQKPLGDAGTAAPLLVSTYRGAR